MRLNLSNFSLRDIFEDRNLAMIMLVFMSIQFVGIEGYDISIPKVAMMALMPIIFFIKTPYFSKGAIYGMVFLFVTVLFVYLNHSITRISTFIYTFLFVITFAVYYNLVWIKQCFTLDFFIKLLSCVIYAYAICTVIQQLFILAGIRSFIPINLVGAEWYSFHHLTSLAIEPSHAARIMAVYFYAFLKCTEYENGVPLTLRELFYYHKWVVLGFLYTMLFLGSGTALVCLAIIALYFVKKQYAIPVIAVATILYLAIPYINYRPLTRIQNVIDAAMTGDTELVKTTDSSASSRVNIIIDTFNHLDLKDSQTWIGHGMDKQGRYKIVPAIYEYGLITYAFKLLFFFGCCFTSVLSLETVMLILIFGMNIGNIAYGWAALMVFTSIKYFKSIRYAESY